MNRRGRVLVIDDDPLFRSLLVSLLRKDYLVSVAADGSEGYNKSLEHAPDVAVVDVQMPGWDGLRTLKSFRSHPALKDVPIVMLTGDASRETVLAAINGGANDYIIKASFSKEEFLQKLDRLTPGADCDEADPSSARLRPLSNLRPPAFLCDLVAPYEDNEELVAAACDDSLLQAILDDWE